MTDHSVDGLRTTCVTLKALKHLLHFLIAVSNLVVALEV